MNTTQEKFGQPPEAEALVKKRMFSLRAIWAVIFLSFLYRVSTIPALIKNSHGGLNAEGIQIFSRSFAGISLFLLFLSWMVPRFLVRRAEKRQTSLFKATTQGFIMRLACLLAVGFFGVIMAVTSKDIKQGLPMILAGLIGILLNFPTVRKFNREASELLKTQNNLNS